MSWVRTYSSTRPPKTKQSPGFSRAMKPSSTEPSVPPDSHFTAIEASATMVPTCSRWRSAMAATGHAVQTVVQHHALVLGIGLQAVAAAHHEVQRPLEGLALQRAVAPRAAHLAEHRLGRETAAQRHAHQVLHQHVQRRVGRAARFHLTGQRSAARGHRLHQLQCVRRHERDAAGATGLVAAAPGALQQARHALGAADLQHSFHRQEVHAQVERRGGHHRAQRARLQPGLDPFAHALVQRAVVQRDAAGPVGPRVQQQLVPGLGLRAHVGEDQRGRRARDLVHHGLQHLRTQVAAPRKAPRLGRQQGVDAQRLVHTPAHQAAGAGRTRPEQRTHGLVHVAQRGRQAPHHQSAGSSGAAAPAPAATARRACCRGARATRRR